MGCTVLRDTGGLLAVASPARGAELGGVGETTGGAAGAVAFGPPTMDLPVGFASATAGRDLGGDGAADGVLPDTVERGGTTDGTVLGGSGVTADVEVETEMGRRKGDPDDVAGWDTGADNATIDAHGTSDADAEETLEAVLEEVGVAGLDFEASFQARAFMGSEVDFSTATTISG